MPFCPKHAYIPTRETFREKAKEARQVDMTACTLLAVLATGRLPQGVVAAEEFTDPQLRATCEALLSGQTAASLMDSQPDDPGRAAIGAILSIQTDEDDESLLRMRSRRGSVFAIRRQNPYLWGATVLALLLTSAVIYVPFLSSAFGFTSISLSEYLIAMASRAVSTLSPSSPVSESISGGPMTARRFTPEGGSAPTQRRACRIDCKIPCSEQVSVPSKSKTTAS